MQVSKSQTNWRSPTKMIFKCIISHVLPTAHIEKGKVSVIVTGKNLCCIVKVTLPILTSVAGEQGHPPLHPSSFHERLCTWW